MAHAPLVENGHEVSGPTAARPANAELGQRYYDTTLGAGFIYGSTGWEPDGGCESIGASTAAAGSTTSDAGVLPAGTARVYPTTGADDAKGVRINAVDKVTGRRLFICNGVGNKALKIYPPTGGTINGLSADAAFSSASGKGVIVICTSSGSNAWAAF